MPSRPGRPSRTGRLLLAAPCAAAAVVLLAPGPAAAQGPLAAGRTPGLATPGPLGPAAQGPPGLATQGLLGLAAQGPPGGTAQAPLRLTTASPSADPLDVGPVQPLSSPTPAAAPEPVERRTDPVTRTLQLALGGAVLLGVAGVTGLYLTREHR